MGTPLSIVITQAAEFWETNSLCKLLDVVGFPWFSRSVSLFLENFEGTSRQDANEFVDWPRRLEMSSVKETRVDG